MANRNLQTSNRRTAPLRCLRQSGNVSLQLAVMFTGVLLGLMGFAVDLGRLYMSRAELKTAANAIALAEAQRLIGTTSALATADAAGKVTYENQTNFGNRYDFGGYQIGQDNGITNSETPVKTYFDTLAAALGSDGAAGGEADGTVARHVRVQVKGESQLIFWSFLPLAQDRRVNLIAQSVAGVSAPLCVACGIEPVAIAAISTDDTTDFGFTFGTRYTLYHQCLGGAAPGILTNDASTLQYVLINRLNDAASIFADETSQLFRYGAQGLAPSTTQAASCVRIAADELAWTNTAPGGTCNQAVNSYVQGFLCGIANRFDQTLPTVCQNIGEADTMSTVNAVDTDVTDITDDYTTYIGNGRRIITVAVVDALSSTATMNVQGFRQFLIQPIANDITTNPADARGRISVMYLGSRVPLKAGSMSGCTLTSGPGKVVLHQ